MHKEFTKYKIDFDINIRKQINDRLLEVSQESGNSSELKKLADLYVQHVSLDESEVLPIIKNRYYNEIDSVKNTDDAIEMLKKLQIDQKAICIDMGPDLKFYKDFEEPNEGSFENVDIYFQEFIKDTALSKEISGKAFSTNSKETFRKILCDCNSNLDAFKQYMKNCIDLFCSE